MEKAQLAEKQPKKLAKFVFATGQNYLTSCSKVGDDWPKTG